MLVTLNQIIHSTIFNNKLKNKNRYKKKTTSMHLQNVKCYLKNSEGALASTKIQ